jgi:hypothetical protein
LLLAFDWLAKVSVAFMAAMATFLAPWTSSFFIFSAAAKTGFSNGFTFIVLFS